MFQPTFGSHPSDDSAPADESRVDCPSLKGEVSNHKGISDERVRSSCLFSAVPEKVATVGIGLLPGRFSFIP
jgi:hypothetical protein